MTDPKNLGYLIRSQELLLIGLHVHLKADWKLSFDATTSNRLRHGSRRIFDKRNPLFSLAFYLLNGLGFCTLNKHGQTVVTTFMEQWNPLLRDFTCSFFWSGESVFTESEQRCLDYFAAPGASTNVGEVAKSLGTTEAYAYALIRRLELKGTLQIERSSKVKGGRGYIKITVSPSTFAS